MPAPLAPPLLAHAWHQRALDLETLESELRTMLERARAELPGVVLDASAFMVAIADSVLGEENPPEALAGLHATDLFLTCACANGDLHAHALLERNHLAALHQTLRRRMGASWTEDMEQILREKLLVAVEGKRPKIAEYAGHGALRGWLRVTATRLVLSDARRARPPTTNDDVLVGLAADAVNPEVDYLKRLYGAEFKAAVAEAVPALSPVERNLLRFAIVEKLDIDEIATIYGVHRTTAGRQLASARASLVRHVRREFMARLRVSPSELESIMDLIRSQLDITFEQLLKADRDPAKPR